MNRNLEDDAKAAVARLTEREKEALRRWLDHKTAKEMAIDLGISHYAVEKRLRMARAKLGVTTSIEAARMLKAVEGYGRAGAQAADLAHSVPEGERRFARPTIIGVSVMSLIAAIALTLALQGADQSPPASDPPAERQFIDATPERADAYVRVQFDAWDRDASQFIELAEAPERMIGQFGRQLEGDEARRGFMSMIDTDGDGRVSHAEFSAKMRPNVLAYGIPLIAVDKVQISSIHGHPGDGSLDPYLGRGRVMPTPIEMRLMLATSFARIDTDGSGHIEGREAPVTEPQEPVPVVDFDEEGNLFETGETITKTVEELRDNFYRVADLDADGRVSRGEYDKWAIEQARRSGILPEHRQALNAPIEPQS